MLSNINATVTTNSVSSSCLIAQNRKIYTYAEILIVDEITTIFLVKQRLAT